MTRTRSNPWHWLIVGAFSLCACLSVGGGATSGACVNAPAPLDGPDWQAGGDLKFLPGPAPDACGNRSQGTLALSGPLSADGKMHGLFSKNIIGLPATSIWNIAADLEDPQHCAAAISLTADGGQATPTPATATGNYYAVSIQTVRGNLAIAIAIAAALPCDLPISNVSIRS